MLTTLSIRNFVLIDDATLELDRGLTVLSGETGAGKTLLTQALGLLRGERATEGLVGDAGDEALIQAVFETDPGELAPLSADIVAMLGLEAGEIVATRRLHRSGRNRCFVNGASVTLADLGALIAGLVSFSGQHEHRRLLEPAYQRQVLDAYAGEAAAVPAAALAVAWDEASEAAAALEGGRGGEDARRRERELLAFQVAELEAALLSEEEEVELQGEQRLLARAVEILASADTAAELIRAEDGGPDAAGTVSRARMAVQSVGGISPDLDAVSASLVEVMHLLDEAVRSLRSVTSSVAVDPGRLQVVEERLQLYSDLARKYGGSTSAAIEFLERGRARLEALDARDDDLERLARVREERVNEALRLAAELSVARHQAAPGLEREIEVRLADLGMADTRVHVDIRTVEGWDPLTRHGADAVEFLLAPNPGMPPRSLARSASGGELSRTLLAIKGALAGLEGP